LRLRRPKLRALTAAGEENPFAAAAASRIWPQIVRLVLYLDEAGHIPFSDRHVGEMKLASLMPYLTSDNAYLYREVTAPPIPWMDAVRWREAIEDWIQRAAGQPECVDSLIGLIRTLPVALQVDLGLPWVDSLLRPDVQKVVRRTWFLTSWLKDIREARRRQTPSVAGSRLSMLWLWRATLTLSHIPSEGDCRRTLALWGTERIRGELLKLGIIVSKRSIRRYRWRKPGH